MIAFIPFKGLQEAKSRWPELGEKRNRLVLSLVEQNLSTVSSVLGPENVYLVTADKEAVHLFSPAQVIVTRGDGLNEDLEQAREQISRGGKSLLVLLPDLPGLEAEDIQFLQAKAPDNQLLLCPDFRKIGTNAVVFRGDTHLPFLFEGDSYARFRKAGVEARLSSLTVSRPGLAHDCDDLEGLKRFCLL